MERKLLERMLGAGALVAALVVVGPLLLDGKNGVPPREDQAGSPGATEELQTRTVNLRPRGMGNAPAGTASPPQPPAAPVPAAPATAVAAAPAPAAPTAAPAVRPVLPVVKPVPAGQTPTHDKSAGLTAGPAARAAAPPAPAAAPTPPGGAWAVQLGTFGERANSERLTRQLNERGFAAFVSPMTRAGKTLYRVRVGPVRDRTAAEDLAKALAAAGHPGPVVPN